jgi:hypothetical protein
MLSSPRISKPTDESHATLQQELAAGYAALAAAAAQAQAEEADEAEAEAELGGGGLG